MSVTLVLDREQKSPKTPVYSVSSASTLRRYETAREKETEQAVWVSRDSVNFNMEKMELGRFYFAELKGEPYLYRKISDHEVEVYGLAEKA